MKYQVTITHDNRKRTLTMRFEHNTTKLAMEGQYFLDKSPSYAEMKHTLETAAISTVTAYDALGAENYKRICEEISTMDLTERKALLSTITVKHPKGLLPDIIYKEI